MKLKNLTLSLLLISLTCSISYPSYHFYTAAQGEKLILVNHVVEEINELTGCTTISVASGDYGIDADQANSMVFTDNIPGMIGSVGLTLTYNPTSDRDIIISNHIFNRMPLFQEVVIMHEIGHALGLDHTDTENDIMSMNANFWGSYTASRDFPEAKERFKKQLLDIYPKLCL